ncbi:hypothetical protein L218DRAFT_950430 [Marasmius fiardii PR-910]|nr:hypothetical protein L218DRAFT_950430 [Marasmius fiardii PR-910]
MYLGNALLLSYADDTMLLTGYESPLLITDYAPPFSIVTPKPWFQELLVPMEDSVEVRFMFMFNCPGVEAAHSDPSLNFVYRIDSTTVAAIHGESFRAPPNLACLNGGKRAKRNCSLLKHTIIWVHEAAVINSFISVAGQVLCAKLNRKGIIVACSMRRVVIVIDGSNDRDNGPPDLSMLVTTHGRHFSDPNFWHLAYFCIFGVNKVSKADISSLYGMGVLQVFFYFRWLVETLQIAIFYFSTYSHIIDGFGDITKLLAIECCTLGQNIKIRTLDNYWHNYIMIKADPVILQQQFSQVTTFAALSTVKDMTSLQSAAAFVVDSIITICLVVLLRGGKSEIKETNDMLDTLILYAINRGFLTAACALINLVLFLAIPGKFYFFLGLVCSSKLYVVTIF